MEGKISPVIEAGLRDFNEWFDTDAGDYYVRDFDNYVKGWIEQIAEAVYDAEITRGDGDVSNLDYTDIPRQLAGILYKISPDTPDGDGPNEEEIYYKLKDIEGPAIDVAFEEAANSRVGKRAQDATSEAFNAIMSTPALFQMAMNVLSQVAGYASDLSEDELQELALGPFGLQGKMEHAEKYDYTDYSFEGVDWVTLTQMLLEEYTRKND